MAIRNTTDVESSRRIMSGKDGILLRGDGTLLCSIESFHSIINVTNNKYLPLGTEHTMEIFTSHDITLEFTEWVVRDDQFMADLMQFVDQGLMPEWNFIGTIYAAGYHSDSVANGSPTLPNGSNQRFFYPYVVPTGNQDLQNVVSGSLIQRAWSLHVNGRVRLASKISY